MASFGSAFASFGNLLSAPVNAALSDMANQKNHQMQKEFAQNSIQWKVEDAKKAGIHPAIALGAQGYSASPSYVAPDVSSGFNGAFKHFGTALDSFIEDKSEERKLSLESQRLSNEAQKLEIEKMKNGGNNGLSSLNPNSYVPVAQVGGVSTDDTTSNSSGNNSIYGVNNEVLNDVTIDKNMDGTFSINYGKDRQDLYTESFLEKVSWWFRNVFSVNDKDIQRDISNIRKTNKLSDDMVVVPLPYRTGSGRRFKIMPKKEARDYMKKINAPWQQVKALIHMNDE